ncbi:hypothetical protein EON73_02855 [bacterium]|nr:MAG: hypothetical protein EON73_02855 [bacterium]
MNNSTTYDIKKIIEQEKLLKAGISKDVVPEQKAIKSEPVINDHQSEESLPVEKLVKKSITKNNHQKKEGKASEIFERIKEYDNGSKDSFMLHLSVNEKVYNLAKQLGAAKKLSVTKLLGFAMLELFEKNPELEEAIKKHLKNLEL